MVRPFCHLYQFILWYEVIHYYKAEKEEEKEQCLIGAYPGIDPGPLVLESDALTFRLQGQIVRRPN